MSELMSFCGLRQHHHYATPSGTSCTVSIPCTHRGSGLQVHYNAGIHICISKSVKVHVATSM